jgi:hypothetical protein
MHARFRSTHLLQLGRSLHNHSERVLVVLLFDDVQVVQMVDQVYLEALPRLRRR